MFAKPYETEVPAHGCTMLKVVANEFPVRIKSFKMPVLPVGSPIQVEESYFNFEAAKIDNKITGYTGKGYLQGINHEWCVFNLRFRYDVENKGNYKIDIRYNLPGKKELNYTLNKIKLTLKPTGKEWKTVSIDISMNKGYNELILAAEACSANYAAFDAITVIPE